MPTSPLLRSLPLLLTSCTAITGAGALGIVPGNEELVPTTGVGVDSGSVTDPGSSRSGDPGPTKSPTKGRDGGPDDTVDPDAGGELLSDGGIDAGVVTTTFPGQTLAEDARTTFGPFAAKSGTTFVATTTGNGDADLYLNFGAPATFGNADCSSEEDNSEERCRKTVPVGDGPVYLMVNAWESCTFTLTVSYVAGP